MITKKSGTEGSVEKDAELVQTAMRIETLMDPQSLESYRRICMAFASTRRGMTVGHLRMALQLEDHLDWILRNDNGRLQLWRAGNKRAETITISAQIAELWVALSACLGRYAVGAGDWLRSEEQEAGLLPLTIAVAMHCHVNEQYWRAHAETVCDIPLRTLHQLYAIAEARNISEQEVRPYEADVEFAITVKGQYVLLLLMADLAQRDLRPLQRLIAQNWLTVWAQDVKLDTAPVEGEHTMLVNLQSAESIQRIGATTEPGFRYLDIRAIAGRIEEVDAYLANTNVDDDLAAQLGDATGDNFAETLTTLEHLYHGRSAAFQTLRERQVAPPNRFAQVIAGWGRIQQFINASVWGEGKELDAFALTYPQSQVLGPAGEVLAQSGSAFPVFNPEPVAGEENRNSHNFVLWRIYDQSAGGLGLVSTSVRDVELAVGTLIMVTPDGEKNWSLARIVRKLKSEEENVTRFGVQIIGEDATPVKLTPRQIDGGEQSVQHGDITGLFLCRPDNPVQYDLLLVSSNALAYTSRFERHQGDTKARIHTTLPVQSGGAWVMIQFEGER